jgi:hypothetical protein
LGERSATSEPLNPVLHSPNEVRVQRGQEKFSKKIFREVELFAIANFLFFGIFCYKIFKIDLITFSGGSLASILIKPSLRIFISQSSFQLIKSCLISSVCPY